jgi:hypothetical protein
VSVTIESSITGLVKNRSHSEAHLGRRRVRIGGFQLEADHLADADAADAIESERRARPLDRCALGIGNSGAEADFDRNCESHAFTLHMAVGPRQPQRCDVVSPPRGLGQCREREFCG